MYDLPTEETTKLIENFKNQFTNAINFRSAQTSLALDSSIWLLEAALNYDFDSPKTTEIGYKDSLKYTTSIANSTINGNDFGAAYSALANLLAQKIDATTKIQVIDVTAEIDENNVVYSCDITLFHTTNGQRVATPCDPFTTEIASPSLYPTTFPSYSNIFLTCSGNPTLDGPTAVEVKLNSCSFPSCSNGYYYTNVTTKTFDGLNYPTRLYYKSIPNATSFCLTTNKELNSTQLNQYKTGSNYLANFYKPTVPSGLSILNTYDLSLSVTGSTCGTCPYYAYWILKVQYGTLNCNNGGAGN